MDGRSKRIDRALGAEIRAQRARRDWTRAELAERSGISESSIQRFESGQRAVTLANLVAIGEALRVDPRAMVESALREAGKEG